MNYHHDRHEEAGATAGKKGLRSNLILPYAFSHRWPVQKYTYPVILLLLTMSIGFHTSPTLSNIQGTHSIPKFAA